MSLAASSLMVLVYALPAAPPKDMAAHTASSARAGKGPGVFGAQSPFKRLQEFMMPLEPGEKQSRFLLTSVPSGCSFCLPGGPESMVEVRAKSPIAFTYDPLIVEGTFVVLNDDPMGMYYRLTDGVAVK
jgi:hypothetical protein